MTRFNINFLGLPTHAVPDLNAYRDALLNFDDRAWYEDARGGASFTASDGNGEKWSLVVSPEKGRGLSLLSMASMTEGAALEGLVSVGDVSTIHHSSSPATT